MCCGTRDVPKAAPWLELVQLGGGHAEVQVSTERKCSCRQGEGREVILPAADWWGCQPACHSAGSTRPFCHKPIRMGHQSASRTVSKPSPLTTHQRQKGCLNPTTPAHCPEPSHPLQKTMRWELLVGRHSNPAAFPGSPSSALLLSHSVFPTPRVLIEFLAPELPQLRGLEHLHMPGAACSTAAQPCPALPAFPVG